MPNSPRSSRVSAPCRLEWRPSRWLLAILTAFALLAPFAVLASEMPRAPAWAWATAAFLHGLHLVRREALRAPVAIVVRPDAAADTVDGAAARELRVDWRGPLAFVRWRDGQGRMHRRSFWPDTLPAPRRRELRLAATAAAAARDAVSMAP